MTSTPIATLLLHGAAGLAALLLCAAPAPAQVIVPPTPGDLLTAAVTASVTYNAETGTYTYTYTVANDAASAQRAWLFALRFNGAATNISSPTGWTFAEHDDRPILSWAATEIDPLPPDFVDDGNIPPSPFTIAQASSLTGFSFESPHPPGSVPFFVQGETKLAQVDGDASELPLEGAELRDFTEDSFTGTTAGPVPIDPQQFFAGGRRPAVDGFLVFLNIADGDTRVAPVGVVVRFGIGGETVNQETFRATLNGADVTASFVPGSGPGELVALFDLGSSPLEAGRNVLLTSVDGIVPGTTRTATDVDRLTFTVTP